MKKFIRLKLVMLPLCFIILAIGAKGQCPGGNVVTNLMTGEAFCSIQAGIDAANTLNGHTLSIGPGTYVENIIVNKELKLTGSGQPTTIIEPAISNPDCGGLGGGSLCSGGSNVVLIRANNITVEQLTINGDNPALTSNIIRQGADIDARNGIITDHHTGVYNNLNVNHVTVKNIYLRGIYASSGGTFTFDHNIVNNVLGNNNSISMFNYGCSGSFTNNQVSDASDAISSNHSSGTYYAGNTITNSASGIHTDNNGDGGGTGDIIENNQVSNSIPGGYGIWVFVPHLTVRISNNTISNVDVGLANVGQGEAVTTLFIGNTVDGQHKPGSIGVYQTTDQFGFQTGNVSGTYNNNFIKNNYQAFSLEFQTGNTNSIYANYNSVTGNDQDVNIGVGSLAAGILTNDHTCNWWGTKDNAVISSRMSAGINYMPYLTNGNDNSADPGFQPVPNSCNGPFPSLTGTINTVTLTSNNDGVNEVGSFKVCNTTNNNLFFSGFADPYNTYPSNLVKVQQEFVRTNVNFTCCSDGNLPLSAYQIPPSFALNVSLINPTLPGTLVMRFRSFFDANNNNTLDAGESTSDWLVFTVYVNELQLGTCTGVNLNCNGSNSGTVSAGAVSNASGIIHYVWRNNLNNIVGITPTVSGLPAGTYNLKVSDDCQIRNCSVTITQPAAITGGTITMSPNPTVAGQQTNTIFLGYGTQTVTLSASAAGGGTGSLTKKWSTGATSTSITVSPVVTTTYSYTITDAVGCKRITAFTVNVVNARCGDKNEKVIVCHYGQMICISSTAVPTHLAHGDNLGPCATSSNSPLISKVSTKEEISDKPNRIPLFNLSNYPNPFSTVTKILYVIPADSKVKITVYDLMGKEVGLLLSADKKAGSYSINFDGSKLASGVYYYKITAQSGRNILTQTQKLAIVK